MVAYVHYNVSTWIGQYYYCSGGAFPSSPSVCRGFFYLGFNVSTFALFLWAESMCPPSWNYWGGKKQKAAKLLLLIFNEALQHRRRGPAQKTARITANQLEPCPFTWQGKKENNTLFFLLYCSLLLFSVELSYHAALLVTAVWSLWLATITVVMVIFLVDVPPTLHVTRCHYKATQYEHYMQETSASEKMYLSIFLLRLASALNFYEFDYPKHYYNCWWRLTETVFFHFPFIY